MFLYRRALVVAAVAALLSLACEQEPEARPKASWAAGPYAPAHTTVRLEDASRARMLTVEIWYPGQASETMGAPAETFEASQEARATLRQLLQAAPADCPTLVTDATRGAAARLDLGARPLVAYSHCLNCGRYASFSLAERLASHGMIVVAPDHAGSLPFADGAQGETLDVDQLMTRVADMRRLLDAALDGSLFAGTEALAGLVVDSQRIGAYGHSFGSVTTAQWAQDDVRVSAAAGLAAPMESFLFPDVSLANLSVPLLFVLAEEDNSIMEFGNEILRTNIEEANPPVWQVALEDAGHWSVSDLCGLTEAFSAGCGRGQRHSPGREGESFDYVAVRQGIDVVQRYLSTFFLAYLDVSSEAMVLLKAAPEEVGVRVHARLR